MNFVFLCDYLHPNYGYQEFHLAEELSKHKECNNVSIITSDRYYPFRNFKFHRDILGERIHQKKFEEINGVKIFYYKPIIEKFSRLIPNLNIIKIISKNKIDICFSHSSTSFNSIILLIFSRFIPFRLMVDCHMHYSAKKNNILNNIFYFFIKFINKYIASKKVIYFGVTKESCDFLSVEEGVSKKQIKLLPIGFVSKFFFVPNKFKEFKQNFEKVRKSLKISNDEILIIQTGKLSYDKRPDLTLKASNFDLKKRKGTILYIGPHSEDEKIKLKKIFSKKPNKNWHLAFKENINVCDLNKYFLAADLLSFPGGASLSCIEGAASGCKSLVAYSPEGINRSKLGIVSVPNDYDDSSFEVLIKKEISKLDLKKRDLEENYKNSKKLENIVKNMSYKEVSNLLMYFCKSV